VLIEGGKQSQPVMAGGVAMKFSRLISANLFRQKARLILTVGFVRHRIGCSSRFLLKCQRSAAVGKSRATDCSQPHAVVTSASRRDFRRRQNPDHSKKREEQQCDGERATGQDQARFLAKKGSENQPAEFHATLRPSPADSVCRLRSAAPFSR